MSNKKKISVIGGDSRQIYTAFYLSRHGFDVSLFGFELSTKANSVKAVRSLEEAMKNDIIILPLPITKNKKTLNASFCEKEIYLEDIIKLTDENKHIFLGMATPQFLRELQGKGSVCEDYFIREDFTLKNALLTSEGIISIILDKIPSTVFGMKIALTGYGRIAQYTADKLKLLGADVSIFARNSVQLAKAETRGLNAYKLCELEKRAAVFDCIVNTVPSIVLDENIIKNTNENVLLIETASAPYGIDFAAAEKYGRNLCKAFSLPGKTAPKTAGIIIGETVEKILKEMD